MVNILKLKNDKENPKVRNIISAGGDIIRVFEPTPEHVQMVLDLQQSWQEDGKLKVEFPASILVKKLFPTLTDIKGIEELSDEDLNDIIENPTVAFTKVQIEIETIIAEIFETLILNAKYNITMASYEAESYKVNVEGFEKTLAQMAKTTGNEELYSKVAKLADSLEDSKEKPKPKQEESKILSLLSKQTPEESVDEAVGAKPKSMSEQIAMVEQYKNMFDKNRHSSKKLE